MRYGSVAVAMAKVQRDGEVASSI